MTITILDYSYDSNDNNVLIVRHFSDMYQPKSTIYQPSEFEPAERLTSGEFDMSTASARCKEVRRYERHLPARGQLNVRSLGGYKYNEGTFEKL